MNPIENMAAHEGAYSDAEARVYHTVSQNPAMVRDYCITKVARVAGVSTSAVMRFCQRMGYRGYKDFRFDVMRYLSTREDDPGQNRDRSSLIAGAYADACVSLQTMDREVLSTLAQAMLRADMVFCLGVYRSYLPAEMLRMSLVDLGIRTFSTNDRVEFTRISYTATARSAIIIFSESGDDFGYRPALEGAHSLGAASFLVTCNASPAIGDRCDHVILLPRPVVPGIAHLDAHAVALAFVSMLSEAIDRQQSDEETMA